MGLQDLFLEACELDEDGCLEDFLKQYIQYMGLLDKMKDGDIPTLDSLESNHIHFIKECEKTLLDGMQAKLDAAEEEALISKKKEEYLAKEITLVVKRKSTRVIKTLVGEISYKRSVLVPKDEESRKRLLESDKTTTIIPFDLFVGISQLPFKISPGLMVEAAYLGITQRSFEMAEEMIQKCYNTKVNDDNIRKVTEYLGKLIHEEELRFAEELWEKREKGELKFRFDKDGVFYGEIDGATAPIRRCSIEGTSQSKKSGSKKKSNNGKKNNSKKASTKKPINMLPKHMKTEDNVENDDDSKTITWKENKLAVFFTSDDLEKHESKKTNEIEYKIKRREYVGYLGSVDVFKKLVFATAVKNGYGQYRESVFICDGAQWISDMIEELFPEAIRILDYCHLVQNVSDFIKAKYPRYSAERRQSMVDNIMILIKRDYDVDLVLESYFPETEKLENTALRGCSWMGINPKPLKLRV